MKQLYYTSCMAGEGFSSSSGLQVRAASRGFSEPLQRAVMRHCYYTLPMGDEYAADRVDVARAPVRFAYVRMEGLGLLALQATYYGIDPSSGRTGNPFIHLVLDDEQKTLDAHLVLSSFASGFWRRDATGAGRELPDPQLPPATGAPPPGLAPTPATLEHAAFVLQALLERTPHEQVFLAGAPEEIVRVLWTATRALPDAMRRETTFTTYERSVDGQSAVVVGTLWGRDSGVTDLPEACYTGRGYALNLLTGRRSERLRPGAFAQTAVKQVAAGTVAELDAFRVVWSAASATAAARADDLHHAYQATRMSLDLRERDVEIILREPALTQASSGLPFLANLLSAARRDPSLLAPYRAEVARYLAADEERLRHFRQALVDALVAAARQEDAAALHDIAASWLPLAPRREAVLQEAFRALAATPPTGRGVRSILLAFWQEPGVLPSPEALAPWLAARDAEDLREILSDLTLDGQAARAILLNLPRGIAPSREDLLVLASRPSRCALLLHESTRDARHLPRVLALLRPVLSADAIVSILQDAPSLNSAWVRPLLAEYPRDHLVRLLERVGARLLDEVGASHVEGLLAACFEGHPFDVLDRPALYALYVDAHGRGALPPAPASAIEAMQTIRSLKNGSPRLKPAEVDALPRRVTLLTGLLGESRWRELRAQVVKRLVRDLATDPDRVLAVASALLALPKESDVASAAWSRMLEATLRETDRSVQEAALVGLFAFRANETARRAQTPSPWPLNEVEAFGRISQPARAGATPLLTTQGRETWNAWDKEHPAPGFMKRMLGRLPGWRRHGP